MHLKGVEQEKIIHAEKFQSLELNDFSKIKIINRKLFKFPYNHLKHIAGGGTVKFWCINQS